MGVSRPQNESNIHPDNTHTYTKQEVAGEIKGYHVVFFLRLEKGSRGGRLK